MREHELDEALRDLPSERASHGFTQRVLAQIDEPRTGRLPWLRVAVAAALILVVVPAMLWWRDRVTHLATQKQVVALRAEHEELKRRLEALRDLSGESQPMVVIGGNDRVDYVIPLETLITGQPAPRRPGDVFTVPASYMEGPL